MKALAVTLALCALLLAALPALFWLRFGTLDPCAALTGLAAREIRQTTADPLRAGMALTGAQIQIGHLTPAQCLEGVLRAETGQLPQ